MRPQINKTGVTSIRGNRQRRAMTFPVEPSPDSPMDAVTALATTRNQQLHRYITALAQSAEARIHFTHDPHHALTPKAPLHLVGMDAVNSPIASAATVIVIAQPGEQVRDVPPEVHHVIELPMAEPQLLRHLSYAGHAVNKRALTIQVFGAVGGVGTTTFTALLAGASGFRSLPTSIVDAEATSCGIDLVFGIETTAGPRWSELLTPAGELRDIPRASAFRAALPKWRSVSVLSARAGDPHPTPRAVNETVGSLASSQGIIMMDAGTSPRVETQPFDADISVMVVPRTVRGVVAAHSYLNAADNSEASLLVVTRGSKGANVSVKDVQRALRREVLVEVPVIKHFNTRIDRGQGLPHPRARVWREMGAIFERIYRHAPQAITTQRERARAAA